MRGLVLGGGGVTGIAWELGLVAGLAERGIALDAADVVVGTSAGSVVGAQLLSGRPIEDLYAAQLENASGEIGARLGLGFLIRFAGPALLPGSDARMRARVGRAALRARTVPESERLAVFESRLVSRDWPDRRFLVTAVDAATGEPRVFDRESGVPIQLAVAASCAVPVIWPPITIEGRRYIDGGVRSATNADLAIGCDRVVVLAPITAALRRSQRVSAQLSALGPGVRSVVVRPNAAARRAIGRNVLDPARRRAAAEAGRAQARAEAHAVREVWG